MATTGASACFCGGQLVGSTDMPVPARAYAHPMTSGPSPPLATGATDNPPPEDTPMFTNVVVGVDGRDGGRDAIRLAHQLADRGARVTLVHVYGEPEGPPGSGAALVDDQRTGGLD